MKLLECRIENFGCLSGQTFVFSDGLTAILEENGFGKSTLAAFIKAMFYGLPPAKTRRGTADAAAAACRLPVGKARLKSSVFLG